MTIVHFVVSDSFGGVEGHICTLIKLMQNKDYKFKIVCHQTVEGRFNERLGETNVDVIPLEIWPKPTLYNYKKLIQTFRHLAPDIVHCHLYSGTRIGAMAAKIAGVPKVIETIHLEEVWRHGLKKWLFCSVDAIIGRLFVDKYIAVSHAVARYYQTNKWVPERKISVIHNTTEHSEIRVKPKKTFSFRIGFLGRLVFQKGIDILISAIGILRKEKIECHLYIGGTGPLKTDLEAQVQREKLEENVTFLGNVSDKDTFFNNIDLFVLPSRFEGFPLVLLEAGMYKMPVVATNVSGNPEIIHHKETGILVQSDNPKELAMGIKKYQDSKIREIYSTNLKELVESEFSTKKYAERMDIFYQSLK
jgi:glycosyltransferase involved in cell wall biosynthesis